MRLRYFRVKDFAPFGELEIDFDQNKSLLNSKNLLHCITGVNGTGKTRLLQALAKVFSSLKNKVLPTFPLTIIYDIEVGSEVRTVCFINQPESLSLEGEAEETNAKLTAQFIILNQQYPSVSSWETFIDNIKNISYVEKLYIDNDVFAEGVVSGYLPNMFVYSTSSIINWEKQLKPIGNKLASGLLKENDLKLAIATLLLRKSKNEPLPESFSYILAKLGLNSVATNIKELLENNFLSLESKTLSKIGLFETLRQSNVDLTELKICFGKGTDNVGVQIGYDDLSDGERVLLGEVALFALLENSKNMLLILDEPEKHFNDYYKRELINSIYTSLKQTHCTILASFNSALPLTDLFNEQISLIKKTGSIASIVNLISPTFGADPSEISVNLFGSEDNVGAYSLGHLKSLINRRWNNTEKNNLEKLIRSVGAGYHRSELRAIWRNLV